MSSPVFAITTRSSPTTSSIPRASFAPPVPPARTTTVLIHSDARDFDARVCLVADVDADQQRGQRLGDPRHLEAAAVDAAQPLDALDHLGGDLFVGLAVAADQDVLVELVVEIAEDRGADR